MDWYLIHFNNIQWCSSAIVGAGIVLANAIQSLEYNAIVANWYMIVGFSLEASTSWNTQRLYKNCFTFFIRNILLPSSGKNSVLPPTQRQIWSLQSPLSVHIFSLVFLLYCNSILFLVLGFIILIFLTTSYPLPPLFFRFSSPFSQLSMYSMKGQEVARIYVFGQQCGTALITWWVLAYQYITTGYLNRKEAVMRTR